MKVRALLLAATLWAACGGAGLAQPTTTLPLPKLPSAIEQNPFVQSLLQAFGGLLLETTNGPTARGKITYFRRFELQLETAPNVYRSVHLHQGTRIDPRGTTLAPGMLVDVTGTPQSDRSLDADTIIVR